MNNNNIFLLVAGVLLFIYFATKRENFSLNRFVKEKYRQVPTEQHLPISNNVDQCQSLCADNRIGIAWSWKNWNRSFADCYLDCIKNRK
jgi:hypothetical protein